MYPLDKQMFPKGYMYPSLETSGLGLRLLGFKI